MTMKRSKKACKVCNKRLAGPIVEMYRCKCGNYYCRDKHLFSHECAYDYHKDDKKLADSMRMYKDKLVRV